jgi:hypothetical protein
MGLYRGVPGAAQHKQSAVMRCRTGTFTVSDHRSGELGVCEGPATAVHHFVMHRVRDTSLFLRSMSRLGSQLS